MIVIFQIEVEKINFPKEQTSKEDGDIEDTDVNMENLMERIDGDDEDEAEIRNLQLLTFEIKQVWKIKKKRDSFFVKLIIFRIVSKTFKRDVSNWTTLCWPSTISATTLRTRIWASI